MKENIDSKKIGNRKIIIELRFEALPSIIDRKGTLIEAIEKTNPNLFQYWEMNGDGIILRDKEKREEFTILVALSYHRLSFTSWKIDTIESFYANFKKVYEAIQRVLGNINLTRIGCRVISTYPVKAKDYSMLLTNFKEKFPQKFFFENYPCRNVNLKMTYDNGMYQIGLIQEDDAFYEREFQNENTKKHFGFFLDTDNYVTNASKPLTDKELVKEIFTLSLAVEKDIYENLCDL